MIVRTTSLMLPSVLRNVAAASFTRVGGGSSEIVWLDRRKAHRRGGLLRAWVSLPVGVVTLAERHGGIDVDATVDLLVDMANPGRWMIHCHVAEHLGAGMMGVFTVEP